MLISNFGKSPNSLPTTGYLEHYDRQTLSLSDSGDLWLIFQLRTDPGYFGLSPR